MKVFIGWDPREELACEIAKASILKHASIDVEILPISIETLGPVYKRTTLKRNGKLWDNLSNAPMSTSHAIARFFVPYLCDFKGWSVFMDGDVLVRRDIADLFALADPHYPLQVVKHCYAPENTVKKSGDVQLQYGRKNWSSVILWNCEHPANRRLTPEILNSWKGLTLHQFGWLHETEIGELPGIWNTLVTEPALVHFTEGLPDIKAGQPYAEEWNAVKESTLVRG